MKSLKLTLLDGTFAIYKLPPNTPIPKDVLRGAFYSISRTNEELSIVAAQGIEIPQAVVDSDWACVKVAGPLDLAEVGILAGLSNALAKAKISLFAVSTFDTDYILIKSKNLKAAKAALIKAGHKFTAKKTQKAAPASKRMDQYLPIFQQALEKIGTAALGTVKSDAALSLLIGSAYEFLPAPVRMIIPRQTFVDFCLMNRDRLIPATQKNPGR